MAVKLTRAGALALLSASLLTSAAEPVDMAMVAFNSGDYAQALDGLDESATRGDVQAQVRLGQMYEQGLGATRDFVRAYAWFNIAATSGNVFARTSRDALERRMTPDQVSEAQQLSSELSGTTAVTGAPDQPGAAQTLAVNYTFGSFDGSSTGRTEFRTFRPSATAEQMVQDILGFNSIPGKSFTVLATNDVGNAAAAIRGAERFILYNPQFMASVERAASTPWDSYSIMAHEIGHHLAGHTLRAGGSQPPLELEADYFSGGTLSRMGASESDASAAMKRLGSPSGSATHPSRSDRLNAISRGWRDAAAKQRSGDVGGSTGRSRDEDSEPRSDGPMQTPNPPIRQPTIARACVIGPGQFCPMMVPVQQGMPCTCFTQFGPIGGIAQ
jgi:hypothetical protein